MFGDLFFGEESCFKKACVGGSEMEDQFLSNLIHGFQDYNVLKVVCHFFNTTTKVATLITSRVCWDKIAV